ncbi:MAG: septal ring lytic transglycosylase RlpA family protein, partial [Acidobacteriota bacterium]|nr:septal ring lytic transglycosylase RlpA family protein [Acidobacteriota bacterium]
MKRALMTVALATVAACATRRPASPQTASVPTSAAGLSQAMSAHGMAGWVGQEFAGRTTANGEIFDPMLMTASHRTLPFGTLLDVHNAKTGQTVRVRVNDRGPYVGDRLIDLSYAAAHQIGLADSGGGEVDMTVVKVGRGDREPPAPFAVNVPDNSAVAAMPATPTPAPVTPVPVPVTPAPVAAPVPVTVDNVQVVEHHADGTETRRQVAASGMSIEEVP